MSTFKSALYLVLNYLTIDKILIGIENKDQFDELKKVIKEYKYIKYPTRFKSNDLKLINPYNWPK